MSTEDLYRDLVLAGRSLRRRPAFAAAVAATVALAVGVPTSLFTLVNELVLRPLPGVRGGSLVNVEVTSGRALQGFSGHSHPGYLDYLERNRTFSSLAAFNGRGFALNSGGVTELVGGQLVSGNFFATLGTRSALGRLLSTEDDQRGADAALVISHKHWQERLGGDPQILGRSLRVNGRPFTVVGVAEPGFRGHFIGFPMDLFLPLAAAPLVAPDLDLESRADHSLELVGRLSPRTTTSEAQADLERIAAQLEREHPDSHRGQGVSVRAWSGLDVGLGDAVLGFVGVLAAVAGLVLVIACVNIGSLLLHRGQMRRQEIALRLALGAGRGPIVRQLFVETFLLFAVGGTAGLLLAAYGTTLLHAFLPAFPIPIRLDLAVDWRVALFASVVTLVSALGFGLAPAAGATRIDVVTALKPGVGALSLRVRLRRTLVAAQLAVSLVLLVTAGLFVRVLQNARSLETGFSTSNVGAATVDVRVLARDEVAGRAFFETWLERFQQRPGVRAAGLARSLPLGFGRSTVFVRVDGLESPQPEGYAAGWNAITPGYLQALGISLLSGRDFSTEDRSNAELVAILSRATAERLFPGEDPLGRHLRRGDDSLRVVGVASNVATRRPGELSDLFFYVPFAQSYAPRMTLVVRAEGPAPLEDLRREASALDPELPLLGVQELSQHVEASLFPQRMAASISGGFGVLGLTLAAIGLYGVVAFLAAQRRRELALRVALGASGADVRRLVLHDGLSLVGLGLALGLPGAFLLARLASAFLPGVGSFDPVAFFGGAIALSVIAVLAADLPARRAASAEPMDALRAQ